MDVVFYDRKNRREVRLSQLVRINLQSEYLSGDSQDHPRSFDDLKPDDVIDPKTGEAVGHCPGRLWFSPVIAGDVGYKSEKCPSYQNWDLYCLESDLVFLRLEE